MLEFIDSADDVIALAIVLQISHTLIARRAHGR